MLFFFYSETESPFTGAVAASCDFFLLLLLFSLLFYFIFLLAWTAGRRSGQTDSPKQNLDGERVKVRASGPVFFFFGLFSLSLFLSFFLSFYRVISIAALDFVSDLVVVLYWVLT